MNPSDEFLEDVNLLLQMEEDQTIEYDDDEAASTEDDEEEEYQMKEGADEMSEEEEVKKETEKKKKKELKVKWKNRSGSKQLGGKMHRYLIIMSSYDLFSFYYYMYLSS